MERLTERNKYGVPVMRLDLPQSPENNIIARLAAYEESGLPPEIAAIAGWVGLPAWLISAVSPLGNPGVIEGRVTKVVFCGRITPQVEVMVGLEIYDDLEPENVFLSRDEAEAALAEMEERRAAQM